MNYHTNLNRVLVKLGTSKTDNYSKIEPLNRWSCYFIFILYYLLEYSVTFNVKSMSNKTLISETIGSAEDDEVNGTDPRRNPWTENSAETHQMENQLLLSCPCCTITNGAIDTTSMSDLPMIAWLSSGSVDSDCNQTILSSHPQLIPLLQNSSGVRPINAQVNDGIAITNTVFEKIKDIMQSITGFLPLNG